MPSPPLSIRNRVHTGAHSTARSRSSWISTPAGHRSRPPCRRLTTRGRQRHRGTRPGPPRSKARWSATGAPASWSSRCRAACRPQSRVPGHRRLACGSAEPGSGDRPRQARTPRPAKAWNPTPSASAASRQIALKCRVAGSGRDLSSPAARRACQRSAIRSLASGRARRQAHGSAPRATVPGLTPRRPNHAPIMSRNCAGELVRTHAARGMSGGVEAWANGRGISHSRAPRDPTARSRVGRPRRPSRRSSFSASRLVRDLVARVRLRHARPPRRRAPRGPAQRRPPRSNDGAGSFEGWRTITRRSSNRSSPIPTMQERCTRLLLPGLPGGSRWGFSTAPDRRRAKSRRPRPPPLP